MASEITNSQDIIDSREIVERIAELEDTGDKDEVEQIELDDLKALTEEADSSEWEDGVTLIRESYWEDYCEELCIDIGDLPRDMPGYLVIDWEATANNIRVDYTEVDFDGVAYLFR